jgi:hypothetical protein
MLHGSTSGASEYARLDPVKLLISEMRALSRYVSREFYYTMTELIGTYGWKQIDTQDLWHQPGSLASRLQRHFGEMPSVILFWEGYDFFVSVLAELRKLRPLICVFADDLHWTSDTMRSMKLVTFVSSDVILPAYEPVFDRFYPGLRRTKRIVWAPHAASPDFFLPFNESPRTAILLSGKIHPVYPLREKMRQLYETGNYRIDLLVHPGYHCEYDYENDSAVGSGYARNIHARLCGFACSLKHQYTVAKFFEIPATGSLLLVDASVSQELLRLGFVAYKHYVPAHGEDLKRGIEFVLDPGNRETVDNIRSAGQELILGRHTTRDRARLIDEACG